MFCKGTKIQGRKVSSFLQTCDWERKRPDLLPSLKADMGLCGQGLWEKVPLPKSFQRDRVHPMTFPPETRSLPPEVRWSFLRWSRNPVVDSQGASHHWDVLPECLSDVFHLRSPGRWVTGVSTRSDRIPSGVGGSSRPKSGSVRAS